MGFNSLHVKFRSLRDIVQLVVVLTLVFIALLIIQHKNIYTLLFKYFFKENENLSLSAQKSVKSSVRNQVFENFNRSRRRLHRRWSPNHRRLSPPISESREHSSFHLPSHHFMSFVKPKHSINSFTQIASFSYDVSSVNISSKKPYSTWTHRDCIPQRQVM